MRRLIDGVWSTGVTRVHVCKSSRSGYVGNNIWGFTKFGVGEDPG
jgi:hypothetical protein